MYAGTGNGMVKSLLDSVGEPCKAPNATVAIIRGNILSLSILCLKTYDCAFSCPVNVGYFVIDFVLEWYLSAGHKCSLDVATILQGETKFYIVLMLAWGMQIIHLLLFDFC